MGCVQSKESAPAPKLTDDLAFLSAFPDGASSAPAVSSPEKELEDLRLTAAAAAAAAVDDSPSEASSSDEDLFPDSDADDDAPSTSSGIKDLNNTTKPRAASFRHTHKLHVGVLDTTTFLNNYIVVDTLGRGSFGKVKLCLSVEDDSLYAVKVVDKRLIKQVAKSRQLTGRFGRMTASTRAGPDVPGAPALADLRREVEVMRALNHPNLVKLYEVIDDKESGKMLMVVEYCEAGALVRPGQLTPERRMPEAIAQFYFRQMAAGLAYLHAHGVVHGDVKPENVLLSGDATVKIGDFGQSQFMSEGEDTLRRTLGTPAFLAPEICAGEDYRGRPADVWALGVSLYAFIYGELPFRGDSLLELYEAIAEAAVPFPPSVPVSMELQDLLLRALHKDPAARITAEELMVHPWVRDEDLLTLMPSLFLEDAGLEGGGFGWVASPKAMSPTFGGAAGGGGGGGAPFAEGRPSEDASGSGGGEETEGEPLMRGQVSRDTSFKSTGSVGARATPLGGSPGSDGGSFGRSPRAMASPTPADVAAAVFPSLVKAQSSEVASGAAFSLGPAASIVGALRQAQGSRPANRLANHPSSRLHLLARDSMVKSGLSVGDDESDIEGGGGGGRGRRGVWHSRDTSRQDSDGFNFHTGHSRTVSEVSLDADFDDPTGPSGMKATTPSPALAPVAPSEGATEVERSDPSAFTVMAQHAQRVQGELIVQRDLESKQQERASREGAAAATTLPGATPPTPSPAAQAPKLATIVETHGGSFEFGPRSSSVITAPADSTQLDAAVSSMSSEPSDLPPLPPAAGVAIPRRPGVSPLLAGAPPMTAPVPVPQGRAAAAAGDASAPEPREVSLSFSDQSTLQMFPSSPFQSQTFNSMSFTALQGVAQPQVAEAAATGEAAAAALAEVDGEREQLKEQRPAPAPVDGADSFEEEITPAEDQGERAEAAETCGGSGGGDGAVPSSTPSGRGKMSSLLHKLSFRSAKSDRESGEGSRPSSAPAAPPPPRPPPTPAEPPIQWRLFRPGQKLAFFTGHSQTNTLYYIEEGLVQLKWEATLPVPLTSVLSTLQQMPGKGSSAAAVSDDSQGSKVSARFLDNADSVALTVPQVANLAAAAALAGAVDGSGPGGIDRSETMELTLQQATQRAELLMVNATGGSLDNLLLSTRGAAAFVGALSMLDPDFFADRWRASAVAQTEVVAIRMTREGLDDFLAQNPLAQVHLRASMARGRAEITKLEALERISEAHRKVQQERRRRERRKQRAADGGSSTPTPGHARKKSSWRLADLFGMSMHDVTEMLENKGSGGHVDKAAEAVAAEGGSPTGHKNTAGLDVFALVSKLRGGINELYWDALLKPLDDSGPSGGGSGGTKRKN